MITKVVHGWRPAGLLAYLLGPGTAEEHRAPRVIASWDGLDAGWQPASTGPGEYDLALGPLTNGEGAGNPGTLCSERLAPPLLKHWLVTRRNGRSAQRATRAELPLCNSP